MQHRSVPAAQGVNSRRRRAWRWATAMFLILALLQEGNTPPEVSAHAAFEGSDPPPNAVLTTSPEIIQIWFTEPLELDYSSASVYDQSGALVVDNVSQAGESTHSLAVPLSTPLARGTYAVAWNNLSAADGHTQQGYFTFTVGTTADVAAVTTPDLQDGQPPLWLQSASRWIVLLGLAPLIALWPLWLLVFAPATSSNTDLRRFVARRVTSIGVGAIIVVFVGNLIALVVQAASLPEGNLATRTWETLTDTRYGTLWIARIVLLAILVVLLSRMREYEYRRPNWSALAAMAVVVSLLLPLPISLNAHAAALDEGRLTAIVFDWLHVITASLWFGGLILLAGAFLPPLPSLSTGNRWQAAAAALPRFSATALLCWCVITVTGAYATWLHVGSLDALRTTSYGRSLLVKLALLAIVLVFAGINLVVLTRRLSRRTGPSPASQPVARLRGSVAAEIALTIAVLFMVGRMTSLQPARDAFAAQPAGVSIELMFEERPATLSINPGTAVPNHYLLTVDGDLLPADTEALLRVTYQDEDLGTKELMLERIDGNRFEAHGSELSIAGEWETTAILRAIGSFQWDDQATLTIGAETGSAATEPWRFTTLALAGMALVIAGLFGLALAWLTGPSRRRFASAALGIAGLILGALVMAQATVTPPGEGSGAAHAELSAAPPSQADVSGGD